MKYLGRKAGKRVKRALINDSHASQDTAAKRVDNSCPLDDVPDAGGFYHCILVRPTKLDMDHWAWQSRDFASGVQKTRSTVCVETTHTKIITPPTRGKTFTPQAAEQCKSNAVLLLADASLRENRAAQSIVGIPNGSDECIIAGMEQDTSSVFQGAIGSSSTQSSATSTILSRMRSITPVSLPAPSLEGSILQPRIGAVQDCPEEPDEVTVIDDPVVLGDILYNAAEAAFISALRPKSPISPEPLIVPTELEEAQKSVLCILGGLKKSHGTLSVFATPPSSVVDDPHHGEQAGGSKDTAITALQPHLGWQGDAWLAQETEDKHGSITIPIEKRSSTVLKASAPCCTSAKSSGSENVLETSVTPAVPGVELLPPPVTREDHNIEILGSSKAREGSVKRGLSPNYLTNARKKTSNKLHLSPSKSPQTQGLSQETILRQQHVDMFVDMSPDTCTPVANIRSSPAAALPILDTGPVVGTTSKIDCKQTSVFPTNKAIAIVPSPVHLLGSSALTSTKTWNSPDGWERFIDHKRPSETRMTNRKRKISVPPFSPGMSGPNAWEQSIARPVEARIVPLRGEQQVDSQSPSHVGNKKAGGASWDNLDSEYVPQSRNWVTQDACQEFIAATSTLETDLPRNRNTIDYNHEMTGPRSSLLPPISIRKSPMANAIPTGFTHHSESTYATTLCQRERSKLQRLPLPRHGSTHVSGPNASRPTIDRWALPSQTHLLGLFLEPISTTRITDERYPLSLAPAQNITGAAVSQTQRQDSCTNREEDNRRILRNTSSKWRRR